MPKIVKDMIVASMIAQCKTRLRVLTMLER